MIGLTAFLGGNGRVGVRRHNVLPGLRLTLGFTLFYLSALVLLPGAVLLLRATGIGWAGFLHIVETPRTLAAFKVTFGLSLAAAALDTALGLLVAWVLVRYRFPFARLLDALVDLPIALPTAVAGITLTQLYADNGWLGAPLAALGIKVAFTPLGILAALSFIGLPFVVRTIEPVLEDLESELEDAAATLGATPWQIFARVILPPVVPSLITGFTLALGRAIGEYGSVIFISGNAPGKTEIVPLLIVIKLEQFDYAGASVLGMMMLAVAFAIMLVVNALQHWSSRRLGF
ncbi:MAG TPA: sulfate ABC transporter permease subunit CysT [Stellaceae bacterium]|nr:sulfate ABC transporter permease subunit CysT [Stellaceae bacterium]